MSDTRKIARVVFTPTGKDRAARHDEWVLCEGGASYFKGPTQKVYPTIYTREVSYEEPPPQEVDLRKMAQACEVFPEHSALYHAFIDRLEAQETAFKMGTEEQRDIDVATGEILVGIRRRLDKLFDGLTDIRTWVDRVKQVIP